MIKNKIFKSKLDKGILFLAIATNMLFIASCSSSPTPHYYSLKPIVNANRSTNLRMIEVLPVTLPDRLNRVPIVNFETNGQSKILDNDRWTSTLGSELTNSLSAGLQDSLGAIDRYNSGLNGDQVGYRIATDFSHFDIIQPNDSTSNQSKVNISVSWSIKKIDPSSNTVKTINNVQTLSKQQISCRMEFSLPIKNQDSRMIASVKTLNQGLSQVIQGISVSLISLEKGKITPIPQGVCS
ncbi:MAG: PqiC family protein [Acinetobacter sp.]